MKYLFFILLLMIIPLFGISGNIDSDDSLKYQKYNDQISAQDISGLESRMNSVEKHMNELNAFRINAVYGFLAGLVLTLIATFFSLGWAVRETVYKELGKLTGVERAIVKRNLKEFNKHNQLRKSTKILVVSRDSSFNPLFKNVMNLFEVDVDLNEYVLIIDQIQALNWQTNLSVLRQYDIIVLENSYKNTWRIERDSDKESEESAKNKEALKALVVNLCDKTSILYFGSGSFPLSADIDKNALVSFSNATSQLYGNLLNMIKFRDELKIKVK